MSKWPSAERSLLVPSIIYLAALGTFIYAMIQSNHRLALIVLGIFTFTRTD